jgi:hypothetical protein
MASASSPQPALPSGTATAVSQGVGIAFLDQVAKLLQAMAPMPAPTDTGTPPGTAGDPPPTAAPVPAAAQPDAAPASAQVPPQLLLPQLSAVALTPEPPEAQAPQPRGVGNSKPKGEPAPPARRASDNSADPATPTVAAPQAPDAIALPPVPPPATQDAPAPHGPAADRRDDPVISSAQPRSAPASAPASGSKSEDLSPATAATPPPDAPPAHAAPAEPAPGVLAATTQPAAQPPSPSSPRPAEAATAAAPAQTAPAHQITPALMQMGHAPDGAQRLTVRLDPPELGRVQIKIDRPPEAPARVEITVEKQETLTLLLRDQPQLQRALDQAGVPAEGRNVTFHVAAPEPSGRGEPGTPSVAGTATGGLAGDGSHGTARQHGRSTGRQRGTADDDGTEFTPIAASGWLRAGLDITA